MRDRLMQALRRSGADFTDVRVERTWRTQVIYRGRDLEVLEASSEVGGIVRCLVGGGWGIAVFNDLGDLEQRVEEAGRIARVVGAEVPEQVELAPVTPVQDEVRISLEKDPREVSLQEKQALLQRYNQIVLGHQDEGIVSSMSRYADTFSEVIIVNSEGTYILEERPDVGLLVGAIASGGETNVQMAFEDVGRAAGFEVVEGFEEGAEMAARRALDLLRARPVQGGVYTVILDPKLAGVFIHEAFGHLCEADFIAKNPRMQEVLRPGRVFGGPDLDVVEDGYLPGVSGNYRYDDEGTPRRRIHLIRDGVLQGFMHSRETAGRMGARPTGNARAVSYRFEPIVRMRNTYIDRGSSSLADMLQGVEQGIYACGAIGGNTAMEEFTFSAAYAYEIVDGQIGGMLRDVVLTGNVFDILKNIDCIGDDLLVQGSGAGGCGKIEQMNLPVATGGPHVRIQNVTIGGSGA
ncbi:MAG: TldD/PmbA family protein [Chloroflexia bacterium]|nr:TldD/PmbA family protein [Chloroflexia bacterium]